MEPRLKTSVKWSPYPQEFIDQVQKAVEEQFQNQSQKGRFVVEGRIYPAEILFRLGFLETGRLAQMNFEISVDYGPKTDPVLKLMYIAADAANELMYEFLNSPQSEEATPDLPYLWKEFKFKTHNIFMQFSTQNTQLEAQADALLGLESDKLYNSSVNEEEELEDQDTDSGLH